MGNGEWGIGMRTRWDWNRDRGDIEVIWRAQLGTDLNKKKASARSDGPKNKMVNNLFSLFPAVTCT